MAKTLYEYYREQGQKLPSVSERAMMYDLGDQYRGTAEQNNALLARMQGQEPSQSKTVYGQGNNAFVRASSGLTPTKQTNQPGVYGQGANQFRMATEEEKKPYQINTNEPQQPLPADVMPQRKPTMQTYERAVQEQQGPTVSTAVAERGKGVTTPTPTPKPDASSPDAFFRSIAPVAYKLQEETGVPASLIMSQAALESQFGQKAPGYNYFGIKGTGPGGTQRLLTWEQAPDGTKYQTYANFKVYTSPQEALEDHAKLLATKENYKRVMEAGKTGDNQAIARAIGQSGYATDQNYGGKIYSLMNDYNLDQYAPAPTPTPTLIPIPQTNTYKSGNTQFTSPQAVPSPWMRLNGEDIRSSGKKEPTMWERIKKILGWEE